MSNSTNKKPAMLEILVSHIMGINLKDKIKLLQSLEDKDVNEDDFLKKSKRDIEIILETNIKNWDIDNARKKTEKTISVCTAKSIHWVSFKDAEYPPLLREIYDPPCVLYYRGKLPNPEKPLLAIVGTRRPSPQAASHAFKIAFEIGQAGISVVSGLALGIDSMAHRGNLSSRAPGYAILGNGIDQVYPSSNKNLAVKILESGGALISEYPPGIRPSKWNFPARNRIISAFSRSVLIVEAPKKSGALHTAEFAHQHGKDLWVASSGIYSGNMLYDREGTKKLADDGAEIIDTFKDVLDKWNIEYIKNETEIKNDENTGKSLAANMAKLLKYKN